MIPIALLSNAHVGLETGMDITKTRTILGREPKSDRTQGLKKAIMTLKHCRQLSGPCFFKNLYNNSKYN